MRLLRVLRGMTGTALSFAVPWTVVGAGLAGAMALLYPNLPTRVDVFGVSFRLAAGGAVLFSVLGTFVGTMFAAALAVTGRSRSFRELSLRRFLSLGLVAGLASAGTWLGAAAIAIGAWPITFTIALGIAGILGGSTGLALLLVARRAPPHRSALPDRDAGRPAAMRILG